MVAELLAVSKSDRNYSNPHYRRSVDWSYVDRVWSPRVHAVELLRISAIFLSFLAIFVNSSRRISGKGSVGLVIEYWFFTAVAYRESDPHSFCHKALVPQKAVRLQALWKALF